MLDPTGDAKQAGRSLSNGFERGATLQFVKALKQSLELQYPQINVILTKSASETIENLQIANFANNLQVDLFLNISFYEETNIKPNIFVYYYNNQTFLGSNSNLSLDFYPYHSAFRFNFDKTQVYANLIQKQLAQTKYTHYFNCRTTLGIPFKPLAGVISPAIGIEIGLKKNGWEPYLEPITISLGELACL